MTGEGFTPLHANLISNILGTGKVQVENRDIRPLTRKAERYASPNTGGTTGHDRVLSSQVHDGTPYMRLISRIRPALLYHIPEAFPTDAQHSAYARITRTA